MSKTLSLSDINQQRQTLQLQLELFLDSLANCDYSDDEQEAQVNALLEAQQKLDMALEAKIDAYVYAYRKVEAECDFLREEERVLASKRRKKEAILEQLEQTLIATAKVNGGKLAGTIHSLSLQKSESVVIDDSHRGNIHPDFWKELKVSQLVDKAAVKAAIKAGAILEFAKIEVNHSLRGLKRSKSTNGK